MDNHEELWAEIRECAGRIAVGKYTVQYMSGLKFRYNWYKYCKLRMLTADVVRREHCGRLGCTGDCTGQVYINWGYDHQINISMCGEFAVTGSIYDDHGYVDDLPICILRNILRVLAAIV